MTIPTRDEIERVIRTLEVSASLFNMECLPAYPAVAMSNAAAELRRVHSLPGGALAEDGDWTEGVCGDGIAILLGGAPVSISSVLSVLNRRTSEQKSWTCFHCGETFTTEIDARNHFGSHEGRLTACEIKEAGEFSILRALRDAEDQLDRYRVEDSDVLRAMAHMQADHAQALRREEEIGYARGLRDAKLPVDPVTSSIAPAQSEAPPGGAGRR